MNEELNNLKSQIISEASEANYQELIKFGLKQSFIDDLSENDKKILILSFEKMLEEFEKAELYKRCSIVKSYIDKIKNSL